MDNPSVERRRSYEARFDRLEQKIDAVGMAINTLARVEERQAAANDRLRKMEAKSDALEQKVETLQAEALVAAHASKLNERLVFLGIGGLVSIGVTYFSGVLR